MHATIHWGGRITMRENEEKKKQKEIHSIQEIVENKDKILL